MSETMNIPSLKTIFSFPFQGKGWQTRFLIGAVLIFVSFIIPIIPLIFVGGYLLEVMRRAAKGEELVLPEWHEWGKLFVNGLKSALISLILLLPGFFIIIAGWTFYMSSFFSIAIISSANQNRGDPTGIILPIMMTALTVFIISLFIGPVLLALGTIPLPVATANMAAEGKLSAAFRIRQWWPALWHNKLGYFIAFAIFLGLASILYLATYMLNFLFFLCCWILPFLSVVPGFYLALVYAALFGETYRQSMEPKPASPPAEAEAASLEVAAPAVEETPAGQPDDAPEPTAEETPAAETPDEPAPAASTRRKKTPPAPETSA